MCKDWLCGGGRVFFDFVLKDTYQLLEKNEIWGSKKNQKIKNTFHKEKKKGQDYM